MSRLSIAMKAHEEEYIRSMLMTFNGDKTKTAKALGIGLSTLHRKIKKYGIKQ